MVLRSSPLCQDPYQDHPGRVVVATEVDHIVPLAAGGSNTIDNLQPLCRSCHSKKTVKEDGGFGG